MRSMPLYQAVLFQQFNLNLQKFYRKTDQIKLPHSIVIDHVCPPLILRWSIMVMYNFYIKPGQNN
jgi:hypothetical protein